MDDSQKLKYILNQAVIEVEHNRSWPTKVMAFYVAINFGLATALIALKNCITVLSFTNCTKTIITIALLVLAVWVLIVLGRNNRNYTKYRKLQVNIQSKLLINMKDEYELPDDWFTSVDVGIFARFGGWGLYAYMVVMTTAFIIVGLWSFI